MDYKKPIRTTLYSTDSGLFTKIETGENKIVNVGTSIEGISGKSYTSNFGLIESPKCASNLEECNKWMMINWATMGIALGGGISAETIGGAGTVEKVITSTPIIKGIQKGVNKVVDLFSKKPDMTSLMSKFTSEEIRNMSLENLRKVGSSDMTSSNSIRVLEGTKQEALKFFESRVVGEISTVVNSGGKIIKIGFDKFGNKLTYRDFSVINGSFPTIELFKGTTGTWVTKIKFQ